jgi:hypothetical protein
LLEKEQNSREIYYHINPKKLKETEYFIEPFRKIRDNRFNKLETIMKKYELKGYRIIWNKNKLKPNQ